MNFQEITISHKKQFESFVYNTNYKTCELTFTNLFCLRKKYGTQVFMDDFLFIRQTTKSTPGAYHYFMPIGKGDLKKAIARIEEDAKANNKTFMFWGITEVMREEIEAVAPDKFSFTTDRDWAEYVYLSQRLITLEGSDLKKRRNNLNLFLNKYGERYSFEVITSKNIEEVWNYHKKWFEDNYDKNEDSESLETENAIIRSALDNFEELGLKGGIVKIDGEVCGYTYGARTYDELFDVIAEKADAARNGIYQAINRDFAGYAGKECMYINREEDLGIEGLRRSKMAYKPEMLLTKYAGCYK